MFEAKKSGKIEDFSFNLKAMCQRCHLRYDAKDNFEKKKRKQIEGYEFDKEYYDAACKRFEEHSKQMQIW